MDNNTKIDNLPTFLPEIYNRTIADFIDPRGEFTKKIEGKMKGTYTKDIIIKFGIDPTRPDIHLGHTTVLRTLRFLQDLGCKVIFLIGDFTAGIGDPTGKSKVRPEIDQKEVQDNMKTYIDQVVKILNTDKKVFSWIRNSDWFIGLTDLIPNEDPKKDFYNIKGKNGNTYENLELEPNSFTGRAAFFESVNMQKNVLGNPTIQGVTLRGLMWTLRGITYSRLIARDMFQNRINSGDELYMHEMLYPIFQGIDSFLLKEIYGSCDLEIGGTDQTFNMLMGRDVMKVNKVNEQAVLTVKILKGTDGQEKMSKSLDNYISINEIPSQIFGKIMSISDNLIPEYLELCTYITNEKIEEITNSIKSEKMNPKEAKMFLAHAVVAIYHGEEEAKKAEEGFDNTFKNNDFPEDAKELKCEANSKIGDVLVEEKIITSKTEWRRLVEAGAVTDFSDKDNLVKIVDPNEEVKSDRKIKVGKKTFISLKV